MDNKDNSKIINNVKGKKINISNVKDNREKKEIDSNEKKLIIQVT